MKLIEETEKELEQESEIVENETKEDSESEVGTEKKCTICIEKVVELSKPNKCNHVFCFQCLVEWSNVTNRCPLCKVEYSKI